MTFGDDVMVLHLTIGRQVVPCGKLGFEWPPPDRIIFTPGEEKPVREAREGDPAEVVLMQRNRSQLTDEQRAGMTHVCRAAEYRYGEEN